MVPVNFVAVVLWETRNEVDAPGQHIRRQMALHIPFEAFRILRLLFYGKVQFATSVRSINRQYHSVTAMLVKRFNVVFNLTHFYSETLNLYLRVFTAAININPYDNKLKKETVTKINFTKGGLNKTSASI